MLKRTGKAGKEDGTMVIAAAPERLSAENLKELRDEIEKRTGKSPEELYEERDK